MDTQNAFRRWFDDHTAGFTRNQRQKEKENIADKLEVTTYVINNWLLGYTIPKPLERKSINSILGEKIY